MTHMINHAVHTDAMNKLKAALVKETIQSLLMLKNNQFDLSTEENIHYAVNCAVDDLLNQKIKSGEIQILNHDLSCTETNGVIK